MVFRTTLVDWMHNQSDEALRKHVKALRIIAIDPGGTTGWSIMTVNYHEITKFGIATHKLVDTWQHGQVDCGARSGNIKDDADSNDYDLGREEIGEAAGVFVLENIIRHNAPAAVVVEDFVLDMRRANKSRDLLSPVRISARLDQLLWELRVTTRHSQMPSSAKTAITDDRLERWGMYVGSQSDRHARDADRHALLFLRDIRGNQKKIDAAFPAVVEARRRGLIR